MRESPSLPRFSDGGNEAKRSSYLAVVTHTSGDGRAAIRSQAAGSEDMLPPHGFHKFAWDPSTRAATRAKSKEPENLTRHKEPPDTTISQGVRVPKSPRGGRSAPSSESHQLGGLLPLLPTSPPACFTQTLGPPSCPHHWFILQTHTDTKPLNIS